MKEKMIHFAMCYYQQACHSEICRDILGLWCLVMGMAMFWGFIVVVDLFMERIYKKEPAKAPVSAKKPQSKSAPKKSAPKKVAPKKAAPKKSKKK